MPRSWAKANLHWLASFLREESLNIEFFGLAALLAVDKCLPQGFHFDFVFFEKPQSGPYHFAR